MTRTGVFLLALLMLISSGRTVDSIWDVILVIVRWVVFAALLKLPRVEEVGDAKG